MNSTRIVLTGLAGAYLAGVWLDGVGSTLPSRALPRVANYFLQIAALFPKAATMTIDYRAEAFVCAADKNSGKNSTRAPISRSTPTTRRTASSG